jgi:F-type H+-transporting ATPase subunit b
MSEHAENTQHTVAEVHQPDSGHAQEGNPLLTIDPGMVIWTWLVFFVFLILLRAKAWKPILKSLDEREESIKKAFEDAAVAKKAIEEASEEQRKLIDDSRQKAAGDIDAARGSAIAVAEEIIQKAKQEAQKEVADAKSQIEQQRETVLNDLKAHVEDLSVMVASRLLDENLDNADNRDRIKAYVSELSG